MKAKMAEKMGVPGMKTVVDDLASLFKQTAQVSAPVTE